MRLAECQRVSAQEGEGDDGFAGVSGFGDEVLFEFVREGHFAGSDLIGGGSDEAELAAGKGLAFGDSDGRAEDAAGHGAPGIDVAEACFRIEGGAGRVVGEVIEASLVFFGAAEDAGGGVAGEIGGVLIEPCMSTSADCVSDAGTRGIQGLHSGLEAGGVEGVDGESAVTALSASGAAGEP